MFVLPVKQIIVNSDTQVQLLKQDGTAYTAAATTPAGTATGALFNGFLMGLVQGAQFNLIKAATRVLVTAASAGAAEVSTYTFVATSNVAGATFRLKYQSLDLTSTENQNIPMEKRYQIPARASAILMATAVRDSINQDPFSPVIASNASAVLTLTAKTKYIGYQFFLNQSDGLAPAKVTTTPATLPINTYDALNNIEWAKNITIDRNLNWAPLPGVSYNSYYFEVTKPVPAQAGGHSWPGLSNGNVLTAYRIYVPTGLTLKTRLDLLATDLNV